MYYSKTEKYNFAIPNEYKALLAFKQKLKDANIQFVEEGGHLNQVIQIRTGGRFSVDDEGNFDKILNECLCKQNN